MSVNHLVVWGIDPGLRDTGAVRFEFDSGDKTIHVSWYAYSDQKQMLRSVSYLVGGDSGPLVFIEDYRVRAGHRENKPMLELITKLRYELHQIANAKVTALNNMGVKKLVTADLMKELKVWDFPISTHHQDLRSAARIALLGIIKDEDMNRLLSEWFLASVSPGLNPWDIIV